jgi:vacuolar-type H+-ATPase subunit I/STV1
MIDESFVQAAIKIRRQYLKLMNNMEMYRSKAKKMVNNLDGIVDRLQNIQVELGKEKSEVTADTAIGEVQKILKEVDYEGKTLEDSINPLNQEIEKLALEEEELWRLIKEKHYGVPEQEIIEYVRKRLIEANLS